MVQIPNSQPLKFSTSAMPIIRDNNLHCIHFDTYYSINFYLHITEGGVEAPNMWPLLM